MRKFSFRLEKIRKFKEQLEKNKKMKLAEEQALCLIEKNKLTGIKSVENKYSSSYGVRNPGKVNVINLLISRKYLDKLGQDIKRQAKRVTIAENDVSKAQDILLKATREKKKYEKLKEKHLLEYNKELIHAETKELDEFGARNRGGKFEGMSGG